jgi:hypothetical protein
MGAAVAFGSSAPPEEERKQKQKAETHPEKQQAQPLS